MPKQPVLYDLTGTANASGACTLRSNRLKRGQMLCIQIVAARQNDNNNVQARIGIDRAGSFYEINTLFCQSQGRTYTFVADVYLESDCQLRIDFTGAGSAGVCRAWMYGYLQDNG